MSEPAPAEASPVEACPPEASPTSESTSPARQELAKAAIPLRRRRRASLQTNIDAPNQQIGDTNTTRWQAEMQQANKANAAPKRRGRRMSLPLILAEQPKESTVLPLGEVDLSDATQLAALREKYQGLVQGGDLALKQGRFEEAVRLFSESISANPADSSNYSKRSAALHQLRDYENAFSDAKHAVSLLSPDSKDRMRPLVRQAQALEGLRKNKQAVEYYKAALKYDPGNAVLTRKVQDATFRARASKYGYAGRGRTF